MKKFWKIAVFGVLLIALAGARAMACDCAKGESAAAGKTAVKAAKTDSYAKSLIKEYTDLRSLLAADNVKGIPAAAGDLSKTLEDAAGGSKKSDKGGDSMKGMEGMGDMKGMDHSAMKNDEKPSNSKEYTDTLNKLQASVKPLADKKLKDIDRAREYFGALSEAFVEYIRANVTADDAAKYQLYYCGMAKHHWIQNAGEKIGNPYFGKSMPDCGEKVSLNVPEKAEPGCGKHGSTCDM